MLPPQSSLGFNALPERYPHDAVIRIEAPSLEDRFALVDRGRNTIYEVATGSVVHAYDGALIHADAGSIVFALEGCMVMDMEGHLSQAPPRGVATWKLSPTTTGASLTIRAGDSSLIHAHPDSVVVAGPRSTVILGVDTLGRVWVGLP